MLCPGSTRPRGWGSREEASLEAVPARAGAGRRGRGCSRSIIIIIKTLDPTISHHHEPAPAAGGNIDLESEQESEGYDHGLHGGGATSPTARTEAKIDDPRDTRICVGQSKEVNQVNVGAMRHWCRLRSDIHVPDDPNHDRTGRALTSQPSYEMH